MSLKLSATVWTADDYARARAVMPKVLQFAKLLYDGGVRMMIGTDGHGGSWLYPRAFMRALLPRAAGPLAEPPEQGRAGGEEDDEQGIDGLQVPCRHLPPRRDAGPCSARRTA